MGEMADWILENDPWINGEEYDDFNELYLEDCLGPSRKRKTIGIDCKLLHRVKENYLKGDFIS